MVLNSNLQVPMPENSSFDCFGMATASPWAKKSLLNANFVNCISCFQFTRGGGLRTRGLFYTVNRGNFELILKNSVSRPLWTVSAKTPHFWGFF